MVHGRDGARPPPLIVDVKRFIIFSLQRKRLTLLYDGRRSPAVCPSTT